MKKKTMFKIGLAVIVVGAIVLFLYKSGAFEKDFGVPDPQQATKSK